MPEKRLAVWLCYSVLGRLTSFSLQLHILFLLIMLCGTHDDFFPEMYKSPYLHVLLHCHEITMTVQMKLHHNTDNMTDQHGIIFDVLIILGGEVVHTDC